MKYTSALFRPVLAPTPMNQRYSTGDMEVDTNPNVQITEQDYIQSKDSNLQASSTGSLSALSRINAQRYNTINNDPTATKKQLLAQRTAEKELALGKIAHEKDERDNQLRQGGFSEEFIATNRQEEDLMNRLPPQSRLANYERWLQAEQQGITDPSVKPDPELNYALNNYDVNRIKAQFGDEIGNYAIEKARQKVQLASDYTAKSARSDLGIDSVLNPRNLGIGALKGLTSIGQAVSTLGALATTQEGSEERAEKLKSIDEDQYKTNEKLSAYQSVSAQLDQEQKSIKEQIVENFRKEDFTKNLQSMSVEDAIKKSEANADKLDWAMSYFTQEMFVNGLGEQVPQLLAGGMAIKISSAVASGLTKGAINQMIKAEVALATRANTQTLIQGGTALAENQALKQTFGNAVKNRTASALGRAETASTSKEVVEANKGLVQKAIAQDKKVIEHASKRQAIKDIKDNSALLRNRDKASDIAGHIGSSVGIGAYAGAQDGSSAYSEAFQTIANAKSEELETIKQSPAFIKLKKENPDKSDREIQLMLAEQAGTLAGKKSGITTALSAGTIGSVTEKLLVGKAGKSLGSKAKAAVVSPVSEGFSETIEERENIVAPKEAVNQVLGTKFFDNPERYATNKALEAGAIGAVAGSSGVVGLAKSTVGKAISTASQATAPVINKATEKLETKELEKEQPVLSSVFGTSSYKDKKGNTVEATKGLLGKTFDESGFGRAYRELEKQLNDNGLYQEEAKKVGGTQNYTKFINELYKDYVKNLKLLEKAKLTDEQRQAVENRVQLYRDVQNHLSQGIQEDVLTVSETTTKLYQQLVDIGQQVKNATPEEQVKLQEQANEVEAELNKQIHSSENIQKLFGTKLGQMISSDGNIDPNKVAERNLDVSFLDNQNIADLPTVYNSVSSGVQQIVKDYQEGKISEEEAYQRYAKAIEAIQQFKNTNATTQEKIENIRKLLGEMKDSLNSINKDFGQSSPYGVLHRIIDNYKPHGNERDDVFLQKFFGNEGIGAMKGYKTGLFDYVTNYFASQRQGTPFEGVKQLQHFYNTQIQKANAVQAMLREMYEDNANGQLKDSYSYDTKYTTLKGEQNKFTSINQAEAYLKLVNDEMSDFNEIAQSLLQGTARNSTKAKNKVPTKPVNQDVVNTTEGNQPTDNTNTTGSKTDKPNLPTKKVEPEQSQDNGNNAGFIPSEEDKKAENETANFERNTRDEQDSQDGNQIDEVNEQEEQDEQDTTDSTNNSSNLEETIVITGLHDFNPDVANSTIVDVQNTSYRNTHKHFALAFAEMTDENLEKNFGDILNKEGKSVTITIPRDDNYLYPTTPNKFTTIGSDTVTIKLPYGIVELFQKFAFNFEENTFSKYITATDPSMNLTAITQMMSPDYDYESVAEELSQGQFDYTTGLDKLFVQSLQPIAVNIKKFLSGNAQGIFNRQRKLLRNRNKDKNSQIFPRFVAFNFLTNLFGIKVSDKGTVQTHLPEQVIAGFMNGMFKGIIQSETKGFSFPLHKVLADKNIFIESVHNITGELNNSFNSQIELTDKNKVTDYSGISTPKREMIMDIGNHIFNSIDLKFTKKATQDQREAITFSLGMEAYNFMLQNNMVQEYVVVTRDIDENTSEQVYAGYTWNNPSAFNNQQDHQVKLLRGIRATQDNFAYDKAIEDLSNQISPAFAHTLQLLRGAHSDAADVIFGDIKELHGVQISSLDEEIGTKLEDNKGIEPTDKDASSKLTTGKNHVLKKALTNANSVAFVPDEMMFNFADKNPELDRMLNGGLEDDADIDKLNITEESKQALRSRVLRVARDEYLMKTYRGLAMAQTGNFFNTLFRFAHRLASNSRIMFDSDLNPVESKGIREKLNPVEFSVSLNDKGETIVEGTIKPTFQVNVRKTPRKIEDLFKANTKDLNATGFVLAVAQALGVKVEKEPYEKIKTKVVDKLNDPMVQRLTELLWKAQQSNTAIDFDKQFIKDVYEEYGTATPRLYKTLMAVGQYKYAYTDKDKNNTGSKGKTKELTFHLYLEADGIANGFYNILKQFSTKYSPAYVSATKRTGNITLDILAQQKNQEEVDKLEGSKTIFGTLEMSDMYQHIKDTMEQDIQNSLINLGSMSASLSKWLSSGTINFNDFHSIPDTLNAKYHHKLYDKVKNNEELSDEEQRDYKLNNEFDEILKQTHPNKKDRQNYRKAVLEALSNLNTLGQILILGGANDNNGNTLDAYMSSLLKGNFKVFENSHMFIHFERGLAKLGVTPAMYGGKRKGITNQIMTALKPRMLKTFDNLLGSWNKIINDNTEESWSNLENAFKEARLYHMVLGIDSPIFTDGKGKQVSSEFTEAIKTKDIESFKKLQKSLAKNLNKTIDTYNNKINHFTKKIGDSIGTFLASAIDKQFAEHFETIQKIMQGNDYLFQMFMGEFIEKQNEFITKRNRDNKLSITESTNGLTRDDVINIMRQMKNVPIIGTAFSDNNELIDSLVNLGNTLLKTEGFSENDKTTNVASNFGHTASNSRALPFGSIKVYHESQNFQAAGASINTSSVPSTEAQTLNLVQQAMAKVGKAFLNVFDGLDAKFQDRQQVGELANKETFNVHRDTNLLESFYHQYNRATHTETTDAIKWLGIATATDILSDEPSKTGSVRKLLSDFIAVDNKAFMETGKRLEFSKWLETHKDKNIFTEWMEQTLESISNDYGLADTLDNAVNAIQLATLNKLRNYVANNYAIRQLESNDIPVITNQFGGSTTGYQANMEQLFKGGLAERFLEFANKNGYDLSDQKQSSKALSDFINSDSELKTKREKYRQAKLKQLSINTENSKLSDLTSIKTLAGFQKLLEEHSNETYQGKTFDIISQLSKALSPKDMNTKIYHSLDDFYAEAKKVYKVNEKTAKGEKFKNDVLEPTNGKFLAGVGIYINPEAGDIKTIAHELIHSMNHSLFKTYFSNNRDKLPVFAREAINNIKRNGLLFANRMLLEPEVEEAVDFLRQEAIRKQDPKVTVDDLIKKYSPARGTAIAMKYAFEILPTLDLNQAEILEVQTTALEEFTAYGLTEANMLRELAYFSGSNTSQNVPYNKSKIGKDLHKQLKMHYTNLENDMAVAMGLSDTKNDGTRSALFGILSSYNILASFVTSPARYDTQYMINRDSARKVSKKWLVEPDGAVIRNSVSSTNTDRLTELKTNLLDAVRTNNELQNNRPIELATILNNKQDQEGLELVSSIRSTNLPMTIEEENVFLLAYATNKVALNGNKDLEQAGYKWLENLTQLVDSNVLGMSDKDFNKVFNPFRQTPNKLAYMLALVSTNEALRTKLEDFYQAKPTTLKEKIKQSLAYTSVYTKNLAHTNLVNGADILQDSVKAFNLKDSRSIIQAQEQLKALQQKEAKLEQVANIFGDLSNSKHVETLVKALQSGQGTSPFHDDMDFVFTEAMMGWLDAYDKSKGRRTLATTLVRLVVGSTSKTYKWYKAKNQNSTLLEGIRERATTTIPKGIRDKFETLNALDEKAIDEILLPTSLHRIKDFTGVQDKELKEILTNPKAVNFEKAKVSGYLKAELITALGSKLGEQKYNQLMWQVKGLGELMVSKQAKTKDLKDSHYIMPNTKAIVNMLELNDLPVQEAVNTLTSIYALDYVSQDAKNQIADLMERDSEAFNELIDSVQAMYSKSASKNPNSLLGEDGFVMNHKDPLTNVEVVASNDLETLQRLRKNGYLEKARLPTGHIVMHTNMNDSVRFTTGMFNLTDATINGVDIGTGLSVGSKALKEFHKMNRTPPVKVMMAAGLDENYYDKLENHTSRRVTINSDGHIDGMAVDLPRHLEKQLIQSTENGIDAIGNYFGRVIEEEQNISSNKYAVDLLREHYANKVGERKNFIPFDGKYKAKGSDIKSVKFAEELNRIYDSLPSETKRYIETTGGVMIDLREVENIVGYQQASIADLWNGKSRLPEPVQKTVRGLFEIFAGATGFNPVKLALYMQTGSSEGASYVKDIILNRSLFIPASNLLSNMLHLWTAGVSINRIVPDSKEGLQLAKDYQKSLNQISQIEFVLLNHKLLPNERSKLTNELQVLKEKLHKSPIRDLVDNGIFNSVTTLEIGSDEDIDFSLWKRISDKVGLTQLDKSTEDLIGRKVLDNVLIRKNSTSHNFMVQTMDYGDFVAKYVLYKHLTKSKGVDKTNAMEIIRDEFVNYTMNRGREFDWANRVGLTWFLSYKLAIQKVIFRNFRRNFLRSMATYGAGKVIPNNVLLDKTVLEQNLLFDSSLDYQLSPSNMVDGLEQFFWLKML